MNQTISAARCLFLSACIACVPVFAQDKPAAVAEAPKLGDSRSKRTTS
jgi:hypothetical protein